MKKSIIIVGLVVGALSLGVAKPVSAKSLYVITNLNTNPTPVRAYDVNPSTGLLTYQTQHTVTTYSGGGVDAAMDSDNGYLFIVYEFSPTVNIIYGKNMKQVGTVNMPSNSRTSGIVYDHKRKRLYAAYRNSGRVYSYSWNATTKKLTYIKYYALSGTSRTYGLDLDEAKGLLYVGGKSTTVNYYDVTNNFAKKGSIKTSYSTVGLALDAFRRRLYTGSGSEGSGSSYLCQTNLDTGKVIKCVSGVVIRGLTVDADTGYVYVTTYTSYGLRVYDGSLNLKQTFNSLGRPTGLIVPGKDISYNPLNLTIKNNNTTCNMPGSTVTYTISYENKNSYKVTNTVLTSSLPSTLSFISASGGGSHSGGKITWKLGTLNAGAKGSVTLTVKLSSSMAWNATFKNAAVLDTDQTPPTSQGDTSKVCPNPCGNGKLDTGETCDTAITSGTGKCPTACNDGKPCTTDTLTGTLCTRKCVYTIITAKINGDKCCPTGANSTNDTDCPVVCGNGVLEKGELCDSGISSGTGKCPTSCSDGKVCTTDTLTGSACLTKCTYPQITSPTNGDGCCPSGANANNDNDCKPSCGNAVVEAGEKCDTGINSGTGKCPATCDDGKVCTTNTLIGSKCTAECTFPAITQPINNDKCCPSGANANNDNDCNPVCGNGVLEQNENCDTGITSGTGKCPTATDCDDKDVCTADAVIGTGCSAKCQNTAILANLSAADGCCPTGATQLTDADCNPVCGNAAVETGEKCDTAIKSGPGKCPALADCNDLDVCTLDSLKGTSCTLECVNKSLVASMAQKDGCCPTGETTQTDLDCLAVCGNGLLEAGESCDTKITTGPGVCPNKADCDDNDICTEESVVGFGCAAKCDNKALKADLTLKDGCCPKGESSLTDVDCNVSCGNGLLEAGETCDPKISSGTGVCPTQADCDDSDVCTKDTLTGGACSLKCDNTKLTADPTTADSCCPQGETSLTDIDCKAACGNGVLEAGEDCDTKITSGKGKCPATAADCDDQDKCTEDKVTGADCATKCDNTTLVKADLTAKDGCCPSGETHLTDKDCKDPCEGVECGPNQKCENGKCVGSGKDAGGYDEAGNPLDDGGSTKTDGGAKKDKAVAPGIDATGGADGGADGGGSDSGCNCQTGGSGGLPGLLLIGLLLVLARRRRR